MPFRLKCASRDYHPLDHVSFVTQYPGKNLFETVITTHPDVPGKEIEQTLWPVSSSSPLKYVRRSLGEVHCVKETEGAEFVENLETDKIDVFILKGQEKLIESYSAFEDPWGLFPSTLERSLRSAGITHVLVTGLAEDYCVKSTSVHAAKKGFATFVVEDCTKGVAEESVKKARKELEEAGVKYIHSSQIKEKISPSLAIDEVPQGSSHK